MTGKVVGVLLERFTTWVFPAVLVMLSSLALFWQIGQNKTPQGTQLSFHFWEQMDEGEAPALQDVAQRLEKMPAVLAAETRRSTRNFWFSFRVPEAEAINPVKVEFPSRYAASLVCWGRESGELLGAGDRSSVSGAMDFSRAGFALNLDDRTISWNVVCRAAYRGPAKFSVEAWQPKSLAAAQAQHLNTGMMLEAGIGVLAIFMLLTAIVNRSALYWTFVGWLLINMRMAALSAGTDFQLFGYPIDPAWLITSRQWVLCMYYAMTIGLFSALFKAELQVVKAGWPLKILQSSALVVIAITPFFEYENLLPLLWAATPCIAVVTFGYLIKILHQTNSRVAFWYSAAMAVSLVSTLSEVVAAATGKREVLAGLNSVTAAIGSILLASVAVAEHMRSHRMQTLIAQRLLEAAYLDSPISLFTVGLQQQIIKSNSAFRNTMRIDRQGEPLLLGQVFDANVVQRIMALHNLPSNTSIDLQTHTLLPGSLAKCWLAIKASSVDGNIIECSLQDITERVLVTERLEYLASHDPLTGCLNLRGLVLETSKAGYLPSALAYFDLDRFKIINDLYGHTAGDNVLMQVAERMASVLQPHEILARVGGDEFVIVFSRPSMAESELSCQTIAMLIGSAPFQIDNQSFSLDVSGGLVGTAQFAESPLKDIISAADTLCRVAKKRNTQRLVVMESGDRFFQTHQDALELINCLERGETPQGLFLVMQPEISLSRPFDSLNFEILVRLRKPDGKVVPAGTIIEAAEAHGKTAIIDRWVVTTAIEWIERHAPSLQQTHFVGLNLSGGSLNDESFTAELFTLFEQHPVALAKICLEITETVAITDMCNMQRFIDRVRSMGGKVGLDDFGAGYSSFGYLKDLSVDALKVDGSLVRDATRSKAGMTIISSIGGLVNGLGMKSVGEFAEDLPAIRALVDAGIAHAQGYGISKPVDPERILGATSSADFIEDPDVLEFMVHLQKQTDETMPLFRN